MAIPIGGRPGEGIAGGRMLSLLFVVGVAGCAGFVSPSPPPNTDATSTPAGQSARATTPERSSLPASASTSVTLPAPVACPTVSQSPLPQPSFEAGVAPAVPALLGLFDAAPIVAVGEFHGWQAEHDLLSALICDPAFPSTVDDIVVEFGNRRLQPILDRYVVDGEQVTLTELRSVWRESTQRSGVWDLPVYERFFGLVRSVNLGLPSKERIRVLAGDPPIDYATVTGSTDCSGEDPACMDYWLQQRDESFADVVITEVLANGRTALVVEGAFDVLRRVDPERPPSIPDLLEATAPGATRVVVPHRSFGAAAATVDARVDAWPLPSLALLRGSWVGALDACLIDDDGPPGGPSCPDGAGPTFADVADAYLYVGP